VITVVRVREEMTANKCMICGKDADIVIKVHLFSSYATTNDLVYCCSDCYLRLIQGRSCLSCDC
jgi:uncharacterized membrane protein